MTNRLNKDKQEKLQPLRMLYAKYEIEKLGFEIEKETDTTIEFFFKGSRIKLYPYSGWHTGKSITDGRGIQKLLNQIKP